MTFQPIIPASGLVGWNFLQRTIDSQSNTFNKSPEVVRDTDYFKEHIGNIDTAADLVSDRRLLRVALGAFGLQDDIDNKYFIQKMLEDGILKEDGLANRLSDPRYKDLVGAFGFGDFSTPRSKLSTFGDEIVSAYRERSFEVAVGDQDDTMRLALNAEREVLDLAEDNISNSAKWFAIMGSGPLREVFETALALPASFGQIDIDKQHEVFQERAENIFGTSDISDFAQEEMRETLVQRYFLMSQISSFQAASPASIALTLLGG